MPDRDVTDQVKFILNDDESLPIEQCVCGAKFKTWDFIIGMGDGESRACPICGRELYFRVVIKVFEKGI